MLLRVFFRIIIVISCFNSFVSAMAKDVVVILEDPGVKITTFSLVGLKNGHIESQLKLREVDKADNESLKYVYVPWAVDTTADDLKKQLYEKIESNDQIKLIVLSAHGNPVWLLVGDQQKQYTGKDVAELVFTGVENVKLSPDLKVYVSSCNVGCELKNIPNFQNEFFDGAVEKMKQRDQGVNSFEVVGHMSYTWPADPALDPLTKSKWYSRIALKVGIPKMASKIAIKGAMSLAVSDLVQNNKVANFLVMGAGGLPIMGGAGLVFGAGILGTGLAVSVVNFEIGLGVATMGQLVIGATKPVSKAITNSLSQYVRITRLENSTTSNRYSLSGDELDRMIKSSITINPKFECISFYK